MSLCVPKLGETPQKFAASMLKFVCKAHQTTNSMKVFMSTKPLKFRFLGICCRAQLGISLKPTNVRSLRTLRGFCRGFLVDFFTDSKCLLKNNPLKIRWKIRELLEPHWRTKSTDAYKIRIRQRHRPTESQGSFIRDVPEPHHLR